MNFACVNSQYVVLAMPIEMGNIVPLAERLTVRRSFSISTEKRSRAKNAKARLPIRATPTFARSVLEATSQAGAANSSSWAVSSLQNCTRGRCLPNRSPISHVSISACSNRVTPNRRIYGRTPPALARLNRCVYCDSVALFLFWGAVLFAKYCKFAKDVSKLRRRQKSSR